MLLLQHSVELAHAILQQIQWQVVPRAQQIMMANTASGHIDGWSESVIEYIRALEQTAWIN